jgi:Zn-dependent peptidase ImmA (M78 family)
MRTTEIYKNDSYRLLEDNNLLNLPIDLDELAKKLDIDVKYSILKSNISGKINYNVVDDKAIIYINSNEYPLRQRFSLAHELSHYIYDINFSEDAEIEDNDQTLFRNDIINPIENRANRYAAKLLMPKKLFVRETDKIKNDLFPDEDNKIRIPNIYKIVEKLSNTFKVSIPAVIIRLHSIGKIKDTVKSELFNHHYQ